MRRFAFLATIFTSVLVIVLPFVGGSGPSPLASNASYGATVSAAAVIAASEPTAIPGSNPTEAPSVAPAATTIVETVHTTTTSTTSNLTSDSEHIAQKPVPPPPPPPSSHGGGGGHHSGTGTAERIAAAAAAGVPCPANVGGGVGGAPSRSSSLGVAGTTSADLSSFALKYNAIRVANCLKPVPLSNFRYDACMETRLFWMAQDPSTNPGNTWGHAGVHSLAPDANGVYYSDAVPSSGCDGNLAGGSGNSGATVAQKWWDSAPHRTSLYKPTYSGSTAGVCIYFAMTHGDGSLGSESTSFTRAAARWSGC